MGQQIAIFGPSALPILTKIYFSGDLIPLQRNDLLPIRKVSRESKSNSQSSSSANSNRNLQLLQNSARTFYLAQLGSCHCTFISLPHNAPTLHTHALTHLHQTSLLCCTARCPLRSALFALRSRYNSLSPQPTHHFPAAARSIKFRFFRGSRLQNIAPECKVVFRRIPSGWPRAGTVRPVLGIITRDNASCSGITRPIAKYRTADT